MYKKLRVIPRIDIKNNNLVKGIQLEGLRVLGNPINFVNHYILDGADEIFYQDIVASLYGRNSILELISNTAKICSIPLIVGGGVRNIEDIQAILNAGADKVAINSAAIKDSSFLKNAVRVFGSSTIIASVEIGKIDDEYVIQIYNGREIISKDLIDWIKELQDIGVGEINLTSISTEGTGKGYDLKILERLFDIIETQLTVHGGFGNIDQIINLYKNFKVDGLVLSSMLHYNYIQKLENKTSTNNKYSDGNTEYLKNIKIPNSITPLNIEDLKSKLIISNIDVRKINDE
tara:strand:- start:339 stop:1208 length:870 start_codon:yes stop_codon:yes gene_type:complete